MKTGIELIAIERDEQINKHGYSLEKHDEYYKNEELASAAVFAIMPDKEEYWPIEWDHHSLLKIQNKDRIGQLTVAGAFIAAELDRLLNMKP